MKISLLPKSALYNSLLILSCCSTAFAEQKDVKIDFGSPSVQSVPGWNNITSPLAGTTTPDLIDQNGNSTGFGIEITDSFWSLNSSPYNSSGTTSSALYPSSATEDSFFLGTLNGATDNAANVQLYGLQPTKRYKVNLYASRMTSDTTSDRTTIYTINGVSQELQVRNNVDSFVQFTNQSVTTNGTLDVSITMQAGAVFGYLGALEIVENTPPTVNAGIDKTVALSSTSNSTSTTLVGSASDIDGSISSYKWSEVSGPSAAVFSSTAITSPMVSNLIAGTYVFRLTVTDNDGASTSDDMKVVVKVTTVTAVSAPSQTSKYKTSTGANFNYVEYLPEGYLQSSNWPVIIFLHGIGETNKPDSTGKPTNLSEVAKYGPIHYASPVSPGLNHKLPCVILAPQCNVSWNPVSEIEKFRLWALSHYKIDTKRQYLTGLSLGGGGCNTYCASYGSVLAAMMPMSPSSALTLTGAKTLVNNHIPVWGSHAKDDTTVVVARTVTTMNNISIALGGTNNFVIPSFSSSSDKKTAHYNSSSRNWAWVLGQNPTNSVPQYFSTIYASGGHSVWDRMYTNATTYTWLFSQKKAQ